MKISRRLLGRLVGGWWILLLATVPAMVAAEDEEPPASEATVVVETAETEDLRGVVVESVGGWALEKAGVKPGDVLLSWKRLANPPANPEPAEGEFLSYFDWEELLVEQVPRGTVVLRGCREETSVEHVVPPGLWKADVRPLLPPDLEKYYITEAIGRAKKNQPFEPQFWRSLAGMMSKQENLNAWLRQSAGKAAKENGQLRIALSFIADALVATSDPLAHVVLLNSLGEVHKDLGDFSSAAEAFMAAHEINHIIRPESLSTSVGLTNLGEVAWLQGDEDRALQNFLQSLSVHERLAPGSLDLASIMNSVGALMLERHEASNAQEYFSRALEIQEAMVSESLTAAESLHNLGNALYQLGRHHEASIHLLRALQIHDRLDHAGFVTAKVLHILAAMALDQENVAHAHDYLIRALEINEALGPHSLPLASTLNNLGVVAQTQGDLKRAEQYHTRALKIRENLAPDSLGLATSLANVARLALSRGDLDYAEKCHLRALRIRERLVPNTTLVANILNDLGDVAKDRGNLNLAQDYFMGAIRIYETLAPKSTLLANVLYNLGHVAKERGDIDRAEDYYRKALRLQETILPESRQVAGSLNALGGIALIRGQLSLAQTYYLRALQLRRKMNSVSLDVANVLGNLGTVASELGDLETANSYNLDALKIERQLAPDSISVAARLNNLGNLARLGGKDEEANAYFLQSLEIKLKIAPGSLSIAQTLSNLGAIAKRRGDLTTAYDYHRRALDLRMTLAPNSLAEAQSLANIAAIYRSRAQWNDASDYYFKALETLDDQVARLGGSLENQAEFRALHDDFANDFVSLLAAQDRFHELFIVTERLRGQSFLRALSGRDLYDTQEVPLELSSERRALLVRYAGTMRKLTFQGFAKREDNIQSIHRELELLQSDIDYIDNRIKSFAPQVAAIRRPVLMDVSGVQSFLDTGTFVAAYTVLANETIITYFSDVTDVAAKTIPHGEKALRDRVKRFRSLLRGGTGDSKTSAWRSQQVRAIGVDLYKILIQPIEQDIASAERILIIANAPLNAMPFAALSRRSLTVDGGLQYLGEWKPIHTALSATVYAELLKQRGPATIGARLAGSRIEIAAFGDPRYPQSFSAASSSADQITLGDAVGPAAADRGSYDWEPLPNSRYEVESIASLFPEGGSRIFVDTEATEERVKTLDPKPRILHLAAHAHIDEHLPMSSFIALTIPDDVLREDVEPDRDNGLLQVWEIFERVRLDADLVVLSACETGLGKDLGGEGLIGMTRAFQYAGARSVMASLWKVADRSTAELMIRFYRYLRAGLPKDEALRAAQMELIRGPITVKDADGKEVQMDFSAPYHWAAFQIYGDWQ